MNVGGADGDDKASAFGELFEERRRNLRGGGGNDDAVVGRGFGRASRAVGVNDRDFVIAKPGEVVASGVGERSVSLDGDDFASEFGEKCGLISGAGADLENAVFGRERESLEHVGDDVGLGDGLALADGNGIVVVGAVPELPGDELVPGDALHGLQHAFVVDATATQLDGDHLLALGDEWIGLEVGGHPGNCTEMREIRL